MNSSRCGGGLFKGAPTTNEPNRLHNNCNPCFLILPCSFKLSYYRFSLQTDKRPFLCFRFSCFDFREGATDNQREVSKEVLNFWRRVGFCKIFTFFVARYLKITGETLEVCSNKRKEREKTGCWVFSGTLYQEELLSELTN